MIYGILKKYPIGAKGIHFPQIHSVHSYYLSHYFLLKLNYLHPLSNCSIFRKKTLKYTETC